MPEEVIVYPARRVRTLDPAQPLVEAVAVSGDRIRAAGSVEELLQYPGARLDDRFGDSVLTPGFVEAHTHPSGGALWDHPFVGRFALTHPDGQQLPGCDSPDAVVAELSRLDATLPAGDPLLAWGLDPVYFAGDRLDKRQLDAVSSTRPIIVLHRSGHLMTVNSAVLRAEGIDATTEIQGVVKNVDGEPTGELQEPVAMGLVTRTPTLLSRLTSGIDPAGLANFGRDARNHGTTTVVDLGSPWLSDDDTIALYRATLDDIDFPARVSAFYLGGGHGAAGDPVAAAKRVVQLREGSTDRFRMGHVKLLLDGSIQGFTARLQAPGYLPDSRKGIWLMTREEFAETFEAFHEAGLTVHVHCNGDEATQLFIETVEAALARYPRWDHRHTVTHSQLTTAAQYRRIAALGMCANIFSNHLWFWGDQHHDLVLGPDRARRMNAAATAARWGVPFSLHCDSPVTPLDPLATASYAVDRTTPSGRTLGEHERISVAQALEAMTLGAAYLLKMDHEIGSIEAGKYADFAVLDSDPWERDGAGLREVVVRGTVSGGRHHRVDRTVGATG